MGIESTRVKINLEKLDQFFKEGKSYKEISDYFGVTPQGIWKAKKRLGRATTREITEKSAPKVIMRNLNTIDQLQKINNYANEIAEALATTNFSAYESRILWTL